MKIEIKWWTMISILIISLLIILFINKKTQVKSIEGCKDARIRPFSKEFFTWNGIVELNNSKQYQPSCL